MRLATLLVAAPLAVLYCGLGIAISMIRIFGKVGGGPGGERFQRLIRVHGNAGEHIPLVLVLLLLLELSGAASGRVLGIGAAFVLARLIHAVGYLIRRRHPLHFLGATLTYTAELGLGLMLAQRYLALS